jgi:hypothetical protein
MHTKLDLVTVASQLGKVRFLCSLEVPLFHDLTLSGMNPKCLPFSWNGLSYYFAFVQSLMST